jgi:hypothetical protein
MNFPRSIALILSLSCVAARGLSTFHTVDQAEVSTRPETRSKTGIKTDQIPVAAVTRLAVAAAVEVERETRGFDFIIAGFPKCGTTTLLKAFSAHDETDMAASEQCVIAAPNQADVRVFKRLDDTLHTLSIDKKSSFKCPTSLYNYKSIVRMDQHSPDAKYIIGIRHPVEMLQSFYNYRVTEIKERNLDEPIPTLESVLASGEAWKGVSMQSTRFDLFLMQMGKTAITAEDMIEFADMQANYELAIRPTLAKVFLYTVDQLEDTDVKRSEQFRTDMKNYLELSQPIQPFGIENKNHVKHAESIDICDAKWATIRAKLVQQGAVTATWISEHFIHSTDVWVANQEHFVETLESWTRDPCDITA